jgi:type IV pilus assembly protein PilM
MGFPALKKVSSVGLLANTVSPLGIDFGVGSLKVLQVGMGEPPSLIAAACVETPEEILADHAKRLEFQTDALQKVVKSGGFKSKRAICSIPATQMFCKHLQLAKSGEDLSAQVAAVIPAQLGCHPDALTYRHIVAGEVTVGGAAKQEVICFAVPRELIRRIMDALKACKLEPVGIQPSSLATVRSFDTLTRRDTDDDLVSLYLDIGAGSTNCMIAHGRDLVFMKTLHIGGCHLDEYAARQMRCSLQWARTHRLATEQVVPAPGQAPPGPAPSAPGAPAGVAPLNLSEPLETLTDEILMCLRYHESVFTGQRPSRVVFVGGEARHRGLCTFIAKRLRIPAQVADPLARLARTGNEPCKNLDLGVPQPGWAAALGLCLSPADL